MAQRVRKSYRGQKVLRPPYNSPFWRHFTQGLLLCSRLTIHEFFANVNRYFYIFSDTRHITVRKMKHTLLQNSGSAEKERVCPLLLQQILV